MEPLLIIGAGLFVLLSSKKKQQDNTFTIPPNILEAYGAPNEYIGPFPIWRTWKITPQKYRVNGRLFPFSRVTQGKRTIVTTMQGKKVLINLTDRKIGFLMALDFSPFFEGKDLYPTEQDERGFNYAALPEHFLPLWKEFRHLNTPEPNNTGGGFNFNLASLFSGGLF